VGEVSAEGNSAIFTLKPGNYILNFAAVRKLNFRAYGAQRYIKGLPRLALSRFKATTNCTFERRLLRSWGIRRVRQASSRAAPAVGCTERRQSVTPIAPASEQWSTPSWLPRAAVRKALLGLLDPDVVFQAEQAAMYAGASREVRGARVVAEQVLTFSRLAQFAQRVLVNGAAGIVSWLPGGRPFEVMGFTIRGGKIVEIVVVSEPVRLRQLNLAVLGD
jgi:hypothetical protein